MASRAQNCALMCFISLFPVSFQARERKRPDKWSGFFLSDIPGRDSRAFKTSAYMSICVRDSTGSKQGVGEGRPFVNIRSTENGSCKGAAA